MFCLYEQAADCLAACDVEEKLVSTRNTAEAWRSGRLAIHDLGKVLPASDVGRPAKPQLVAPKHLAKRGMGTPLGRAVLLHAIAHIEFNAINLAWDAVQRFRNMPRGYYDDWVRVADEEGEHFILIREHLRTYGHDYGDFDAHNGLWEMAEKTVGDVLEARGLDVTPGMIAKMQQAGDGRAADILQVILRDEVGHVEIGTRWFRHCCKERGLDPDRHFVDLLRKHFPGGLKGGLNMAARKRAGFTEWELKYAREAA